MGKKIIIDNGETKIVERQSLGEEIANAVSHGLMAIFGIVALILLIIKSDNGRELAAAIIFGMGIIILYLMSTLYHSFFHKKTKSVFRRFDHLSIYMLIGGTFAPFLLLVVNKPTFFNGQITLGVLLFVIQWILIIVGVIFKSIWIKKFGKLHVFFFLAMGWSALIFIQSLINYRGSNTALYLVIAGGVSYSIGVVFYALGKIKYFHFIWHIFVALGTILQFIAVYGYVY